MSHSHKHVQVVRILREHLTGECECVVSTTADCESFERNGFEDFSFLLGGENSFCSVEECECDVAVFDLQDLNGNQFGDANSFVALWKPGDEIFGCGEF